MASIPADTDAAARRALAFARIRQWGDPILRTPTRAVTAFDGALQQQIAAMLEILEDVDGAGLAAPQAGYANRVLAYHAERGDAARVLVNPVVEERSAQTTVALEGCLSLGRAGVLVEVERAQRVVVRAQDPDGATVTIEAEDDHARVLQHEIDHLDGVLMTERAAREQRREALAALREGRDWAPPQPDGPADPPEADGPADDA
jgi:peptide deformylase